MYSKPIPRSEDRDIVILNDDYYAEYISVESGKDMIFLFSPNEPYRPLYGLQVINDKWDISERSDTDLTVSQMLKASTALARTVEIAEKLLSLDLPN